MDLTEEYITGYIPMPAYRKMQEVYGDWLHTNYGRQFDVRIVYNM